MNRTDDGAVFCCESFYMYALTSIEKFTFAFYNNIEIKYFVPFKRDDKVK